MYNVVCFSGGQKYCSVHGGSWGVDVPCPDQMMAMSVCTSGRYHDCGNDVTQISCCDGMWSSRGGLATLLLLNLELTYAPVTLLSFRLPTSIRSMAAVWLLQICRRPPTTIKTDESDQRTVGSNGQ